MKLKYYGFRHHAGLKERPGFRVIKNNRRVNGKYIHWKEIIECMESISAEFGEDMNVDVLFYERRDLHDEEFFTDYWETFGRKDAPNPVIALGSLNVQNLYPAEVKHINYLRARCFDSSIWNLHVNLIETTDIKGAITDRLSRIGEYHNSGYYQLSVTRELFELNCRIMANSTLQKEGGHAQKVLPYTFHSERRLHALFNMRLASVKEIIGEFKLEWRVLLVDDFSEKALSMDGVETSTGPNKKEIVQKLISEFIACNQITVSVKSVSSIKEAIALKEMYDIIMVDFLFNGEPSDKELNSNAGSKPKPWSVKDLKVGVLHYGTSFLEGVLLKENSKDDLDAEGRHFKEEHSLVRKSELNQFKLPKGPFGKYWILPITTFSQCMIDEMRNQGIGFVSKNYFITRGADPISTPFNFLHSLISLMENQLEDFRALFGIKGKLIEEIKEVMAMYKSSTPQKDKVPFYYNKFEKHLRQLNLIKDLEQDQEYDSVLARAISTSLSQISYAGNKLDAILSNYGHFLYGLAFEISEAELYDTQMSIDELLDTIEKKP